MTAYAVIQHDDGALEWWPVADDHVAERGEVVVAAEPQPGQVLDGATVRDRTPAEADAAALAAARKAKLAEIDGWHAEGERRRAEIGAYAFKGGQSSGSAIAGAVNTAAAEGRATVDDLHQYDASRPDKVSLRPTTGIPLAQAQAVVVALGRQAVDDFSLRQSLRAQAEAATSLAGLDDITRPSQWEAEVGVLLPDEELVAVPDAGPDVIVEEVPGPPLAEDPLAPVDEGIADTEFPDGDTPYSRAIELANFTSLAWTHVKRGDHAIGERITLSAHELLNATKTGWTSWPEADTGNTVMQKDSGIPNPAGEWVSLHVVTRTEGPVIWVEIRDGDWGTVTSVEVVHG